MRCSVIIIALILSPAFASAQSIEVFATTGVVQLWDDESNLGVGVPIGGGVGFKSPHGWGLEVLAETQKAKRNFDSDVRFDSTVTAGRVRILKYFGSGRTQPVRRRRSRPDARDVDTRLTCRLHAYQQCLQVHEPRYRSERIQGGHACRVRRRAHCRRQCHVRAPGVRALEGGRAHADRRHRRDRGVLVARPP